ncbi:hypothetical protein C0993_002723 [Termitomyces sp. T159_Od127]|nr:hypothetical protein C0993_002723 [Termitomyces sp. T159_Od127]
MDKVHLHVMMGEHMETLVFDIADIGDDNLILGMNWLHRHNPTINWEWSTVEFDSAWCWEDWLQVAAMASMVVAAGKHTRHKRAGRSAEPQCVVWAFVWKSTCSTLAGQHLLVAVQSKWHSKLKKACTRKTCFLRNQKKEAVEVARACIDDAINHAEEGSVFLEQQWDQESVQGTAGPWLLLTDVWDVVGQSFAQALAEGALTLMEERLVSDMVPVEFHEFLDVLDKVKSERLPEHHKYNLGIDLINSVEIPPPRKLDQLAPAELQAL